MKTNKTIEIALVDDQNLFREGMNLILSTFEEIEIVMEANSGMQLLEKLQHKVPDLILLDYTMPEMDGYQTMLEIKSKFPQVKVIILTMHYDENLMSFMMEKGADGYLLKDETSDVVRHAIIEVMERGHFFPSYVSKAILNQLQVERSAELKRKNINTNQKTFSLREQEILALIGKYNRQEIANKLFISIKTVDFHLKKLRDKTNLSSSTELVRFALKNGFQQ